eukprot:CAMPEP_0184498262 /NCGR_PEP_ID=MMETSP0113_2-20130426/38521_1 /TAXON_ID=91329 /ORGANISM="Norrisiella sphaerica, Strain BC52" /LENGTH=270 /DNA_ID=CAMNT_0026885697 /DNA_START=107 /DNA_END=916 /DNA_ORIENTATION=+
MRRAYSSANSNSKSTHLAAITCTLYMLICCYQHRPAVSSTLGARSHDGGQDEKATEARESGVKEREETVRFGPIQAPVSTIKKLKALGIVHPTPIQKAAMDRIYWRANTVIHAETGSGKTLAYLLPVIATSFNRTMMRVPPKPPRAKKASKTSATSMAGTESGPQTLIMVPSPDLAEQVAQWIEALLPDQLRSKRNETSPNHSAACAVISSETPHEPMLEWLTSDNAPWGVVGTPVGVYRVLSKMVTEKTQYTTEVHKNNDSANSASDNV